MLDDLNQGLRDPNHIKSLTYGAAFLGCGGGGDPYIGALLIKDAFERYGPPTIIAPTKVPNTAKVATIAGFGAPLIQTEKLLGIDEAAHALNSLEQLTETSVDYLYAAELGGNNVALPLALSAMTGKPLIDADGMGRAFPQLNMTTFSLSGISATPCIFSNEHGASMALEDMCDAEAETKGRRFTVESGMRTMFAGCVMSGKSFKRFAVRNTISLSFAIGDILFLHCHDSNRLACIGELVRQADAHGSLQPLLSGKVTDVQMGVTAGFLRGSVDVTNEKDDTAHVTFKNEYLEVVSEQGRVAAAPDLIILLDKATLQPLTTPQLRYGVHVEIIRIGAPPIFLDESHQHVVGIDALLSGMQLH